MFFLCFRRVVTKEFESGNNFSDQAKYQKVFTLWYFCLKQVYRKNSSDEVLSLHLYRFYIQFSLFSRGLFGHRKEWRNVMSNALFKNTSFLKNILSLKKLYISITHSLTNCLWSFPFGLNSQNSFLYMLCFNSSGHQFVVQVLAQH